MSTADTALMTADEFLALPDDGKQRWLINGQLREKETPDSHPRDVRLATWCFVSGTLFVLGHQGLDNRHDHEKG